LDFSTVGGHSACDFYNVAQDSSSSGAVEADATSGSLHVVSTAVVNSFRTVNHTSYSNGLINVGTGRSPFCIVNLDFIDGLTNGHTRESQAHY